MSIASSERGAQKMVYFILTYRKNTNQEIMYGEVLNGPFSLILKHSFDDNIKLGKLGKDSLDKIGRILKTYKIPLLLFHAEG